MKAIYKMCFFCSFLRSSCAFSNYRRRKNCSTEKQRQKVCVSPQRGKTCLYRQRWISNRWFWEFRRADSRVFRVRISSRVESIEEISEASRKLRSGRVHHDETKPRVNIISSFIHGGEIGREWSASFCPASASAFENALFVFPFRRTAYVDVDVSYENRRRLLSTIENAVIYMGETDSKEAEEKDRGSRESRKKRGSPVVRHGARRASVSLRIYAPI